MRMMRLLGGFLLVLLAPLSAGSEQQASDAAVHAWPVRVAAVGEAPGAPPIRAVGQLAPGREYVLAFKTAGVLRDLRVDEGDRVTRGQLLAAIDPRDVDASYSQATEAAAKAERDLVRVERLHARGFASDAALDDARASAAAARAAADAARSTRAYATIEAPADGTVMRRHVEANSVVAAGTPVLTLSDTSEAFVLRVGMSDRDVVRIALGDKAEIVLDAFPTKVFVAEVSMIASDADAATGMFPVELRLAPQDQALKGGLVGRAGIVPSVRRAASLAVPLSSLLEGDGDGAVVFVVDASTNIAKRRSIAIGVIVAGYAEVTAGLAAGELVIVDGAGFLADDAPVTIAASIAVAGE